MSRWTVLARMPDRSYGGILHSTESDVSAEFSLSLRHNEVGSWEITLSPELTPPGWPTANAGIVFMRDGKVVASGSWDVNSFSQDAESEPAGILPLKGDTDLARPAYRIVYPSPDNPASNQLNRHYVHEARPETVLRTLISRQAGPAAQVARRTPGLTIAPDQGIPGSNYKLVERFTPLLEAARKVADARGLRFDVVDTLQGTMQFRVWQVRDLSNQIRFGWDLGNVIQLEVSQESPIANTAIVAGQDEGPNRQILEVVDATSAWHRREIFVDQRQTDDPSEQQKAGEEAVETNREKFAVAATVVDTKDVKWGRDFDLGDKVSVMTDFGPVTEVVREVQIQVSESGVEDVSAVIGSTEERPLEAQVRRLLRRVSQLERSL